MMQCCTKTRMRVQDENGETFETYGILVRDAENNEVLFAAEDLSFDEAAVEELVRDWNALQPEPVHFTDITADFVCR